MISRRPSDLEQLLELDEVRIDVGGGFWVALRAKRVPRTVAKPHGVDYSLCLIGPDETRLVCYDNAHVVREGKRRGVVANDHRHFRGVIRPYRYVDAGSLLVDFWTDVCRVLKDEGLL